jgi:hypothetical protein
LRNALLSCNAPATSREFNVLRMAFDLALALRVALPVELNCVFCPAALVEGEWTATDRLPRELGAAAERGVAGLALT